MRREIYWYEHWRQTALGWNPRCATSRTRVSVLSFPSELELCTASQQSLRSLNNLLHVHCQVLGFHHSKHWSCCSCKDRGREGEEKEKNNNTLYSLPQSSGKGRHGEELKRVTEDSERKRKEVECQPIMAQSVFILWNGTPVPHLEEWHLYFYTFSSISVHNKAGLLNLPLAVKLLPSMWASGSNLL